MLISHWFSPVMYRVPYSHACTHISVSINRTTSTFNLILSLSLSHVFSFNFYLPVCPSKNIHHGIEIISCFQHEYDEIEILQKKDNLYGRLMIIQITRTLFDVPVIK